MVLRHHCGISVTHSLPDAHSFIQSLRHRGRDAGGIAAVADDAIDIILWRGSPGSIDLSDLVRVFSGDRYHTFLSHVRYATRGNKDRVLEDAHPRFIGGRVENRESHIVVRGANIAMVHNGQVKLGDFSDSSCDTDKLLSLYKQRGEGELLREVPGAFTVGIADVSRKEVIIMRDRTGVRPGVLGFKDGKYVAASEDIALTENDASFVEDLEPGTVYYINSNGAFRREKVIDPRMSRCIFEWIYLASQNSVLDGRSVRAARTAFGEALAKEHNIEAADYVTHVPRCPEFAARSYAAKTDIPFLDIFCKLRSERSFQGPTNGERKRSIGTNLFLVPGIEETIGGKTVVVIEDSIVRGNASKHMRDLLESAGVGKIHLLSYASPIGIIGKDGKERYCDKGVDMPPDDEFLAKNKTIQQISEAQKMDVRYLSVEGMLGVMESFGLSKDELCYFCMGGPQPEAYSGELVKLS